MVIPRYFCILPRVISILAIFPYSASMSARTLEKMSVSTCDIFVYSTFQSMVHCLSFTIFLSRTSHIRIPDSPFLLVFWRVFVQSINYASRLPYIYIALLDSAYIHLFPWIYICRWSPCSRLGRYIWVESLLPHPSWRVCLLCCNKFVESLLEFQQLLNPGPLLCQSCMISWIPRWEQSVTMYPT